MESSIKTLTITGAAASSGSEVKKSRRGQSRRKKVEENESLETPINPFNIEKSEVQTIVTKPLVTKAVVSKSMASKPQIQNLQTPSLVTEVTANQETEKPARSTTSVILNPPKVQRVKLQPKATHVQHIQKQVAGTRKARRISLSLSNLNHRFTRAKRVHDDTQKKPIDSIRSYLVEKGVIQMKSRAPEKMLRSMYNDFNMLKDGQAL
jgi:hypothetical protein